MRSRASTSNDALDLPAAVGAEEAPELLLLGPSLPRGLLRKCGTMSRSPWASMTRSTAAAPRERISSSSRSAAYVETESFHLGASEVGADAGPLEAASEVAFLGGVTQRQSDVGPVRAEQVQEASDVLRAHRHDGNALIMKPSTAAPSERFERELVAHSFDEHDRPR